MLKIINDTNSDVVAKAIEIAFGGKVDYSIIGGSPLSQYPRDIIGIKFAFYEAKDIVNPKLGTALAFNQSANFVEKFDIVKINQDILIGPKQNMGTRLLAETLIHEVLHDSEIIESRAVQTTKSLTLGSHGFTSAEAKLVKTIIEELVIRSTVSVVLEDNGLFESKSNLPSFKFIIDLIRESRVFVEWKSSFFE